MNYRFYNARILSGENLLENSELWVQDNRITYIGSPKKSNIKWVREIDARGNLLMPGFKNAHTHSAMTFLRSYADDLPLIDWLNKQVFPMEAKLGEDDVYYLSKLAIMEYLTSGITANFDMYFFPESIARASVECGFRTVLCSCIHNFYSNLQEVEEHYNRFNNYNELISITLGFHGEYTTSRSILEGISELSKKYKAPVFTHNSESYAEVKGCMERNGQTPTVYLNSIGLFDYGGGGYHCVHMTDEDLQIFKEKKLTVVTNPGSNSKLASGIAPVKKMIDMGINIAIGTDGPASNNCLDMFREMFLTTALQKIKENDASVVDAASVLNMATKGGSKAMLLNDCDILAAGKLADLIMIDLHQPNMQPLNNIVKNIVYSGSKQNVKLTMINGKILYEDNKFFINADPEEIYSKANEIIGRIKES